MTRPIVLVVAVLLSMPGVALAQPPRDPALLIPQEAPPLAYTAVAEAVKVPAGMTMGPSADVAFDARGHLFVLTRGNPAMWEFDPTGTLVRTFASDLLTRSHGLHVDRGGNFWVTDVGSHAVYKLNPQGEVVMTLGTPGTAGTWDEAAGTRLLDEPNDVVVAADGIIYVAQGHRPGPRGDPRVLKFSPDGKLLTSWGGKGDGPGQFEVAHGVALDKDGLLWVMDRENSRIQVFDTDGKFVRAMEYAGLPCGVDIGADAVFMVNGFTGQIVKLDLQGKVLGAIGQPGKDLGQFGEAHYIAVSPTGDLYVSDTVNRTLHKFVPQR